MTTKGETVTVTCRHCGEPKGETVTVTCRHCGEPYLDSKTIPAGTGTPGLGPHGRLRTLYVSSVEVTQGVRQ